MRRTRIERSRVSGWLSLAFALLLSSNPASAQPADPRVEARSHFDQGVGLARRQAYAEALSEFERAYQISPHFSVQYNIGQALIALGRSTEAVAALTHYLEEGGPHVEARRRQEVEAAIAAELAKTSNIEITVDVAGALVTIDGEPTGRSPLTAPVRVDGGSHHVVATLESGERREANIATKAGQNAQAYLEFGAVTSVAPVPPSAPPPASAQPGAAESVPLPPPPSPQKPPATTTHHSTQKTLAYVVGATGIALTGAAAAHFFWNRSRHEEWQSRYDAYYADPTEQNRDSANSLAQSVSNASAVTVGLAIGAGVALGTGAVLLLTSRSSVTAAGSAGSGGPFMTLRGKF